MKYEILMGTTKEGLAIAVNMAIANGYTPLGGVCATVEVAGINIVIFYQALIKN